MLSHSTQHFVRFGKQSRHLNAEIGLIMNSPVRMRFSSNDFRALKPTPLYQPCMSAWSNQPDCSER
jgi:hypothetical protein